MADWRQGDIARPGRFVYIADSAIPLTPETSSESAGDEGAVIIETEVEAMVVVTQTCDIVRTVYNERTGAGRPFVQVAPLVHLTGAELREATLRRRPRFAAVPGVANDAFADLDRCTTVEKSVLAALNRERGCPDDATKRAFGSAVARNRGRFAFPDAVEEAIEPMRQELLKRAGKNSPLGRRLDELDQIRARGVPHWDAEPIEQLDLFFLVNGTSLPQVQGDDGPSREVSDWLNSPRSLSDLAERIESLEPPADRSLVWQVMVERWASLVVTGCGITEVSGSAESIDEFPMGAIYWTEQLDLDQASMPSPDG